MDVMVDGQENESLQITSENILGAIREISDLLLLEKRAIVSITLDGETLSPAQLNTQAQKNTSDFASLTVESQTISLLVVSSLKEMADILPELPKACHTLAEVFHGEDPESGFEPFHNLADIWSEVKFRQQQVLTYMHLDPDKLVINDISFELMHQELNKFLAEAAEALETGDCVSLGDLLEYELAPRAEAESSFVAMLQTHAQGMDG